MRVFLSWSGERSKQLATALAKWLPRVVQALEPWMSPDIEKGGRWASEIRDKLEASDFGVICLTRDNLKSPWLLFEAGALSKANGSMVWTVLLDVAPSDIEQPLAQFQHTTIDRDDVYRLVLSVNAALARNNERPVQENVLLEVFERDWPTLAQQVASIPKAESHPPLRTPDDMIREVLDAVRVMSRTVTPAHTELMSEFRNGAWAHYRVLVQDSHPPRIAPFIARLDNFTRSTSYVQPGAGVTTIYTNFPVRFETLIERFLSETGLTGTIDKRGPVSTSVRELPNDLP